MTKTGSGRVRFDGIAQAMLVLAAFSVVMPTAWINIALGLFLIAWLLGGGLHDKWSRMIASPVAWASVLLFLLLAIGVAWSTVDHDQALDGLNKYHKLLYVPLLIAGLRDPLWRRRAVYAFLAGVAVMVLASYGAFFGLVEGGHENQPYAVIRGRIAHNFFLAFACYLVLLEIDRSERWRYAWWLLLALFVFNLMVMVQGRTGQLVFLVLLAWWGLRRWRWKGMLGAALVGGAILLGAYQASDAFRDRADVTVERVAMLFDPAAPTDPDDATLSVSRVVVYRETIRMFLAHPWIGTGTGSFAHEYRQHIARYLPDGEPFDNPHSEYFSFGIQLGLVGIAALLAWFAIQWRETRRLPDYEREIAHGLIVAMLVGCLFNSLLLDHGEGKFYVVMLGILFSAAVPAAHRSGRREA